MSLPRGAFLLPGGDQQSPRLALDVRHDAGAVEVTTWIGRSGLWVPLGPPTAMDPQFARRFGRRFFREAEKAAAWKRAAKLVRKGRK
jgi:hypothetical protein